MRGIGSGSARQITVLDLIEEIGRLRKLLQDHARDTARSTPERIDNKHLGRVIYDDPESAHIARRITDIAARLELVVVIGQRGSICVTGIVDEVLAILIAYDDDKMAGDAFIVEIDADDDRTIPRLAVEGQLAQPWCERHEIREYHSRHRGSRRSS